MFEKTELKKEAIKLRKRGYSYSEILKAVPVAKSTLSLWLRDVGLSKTQKITQTKKRIAAAKRGGDARWNQRVLETREIYQKAFDEIGDISNKELKLIGTALYWAEGSKERGNASGLDFGNSDPLMLKVYIQWLTKSLGVKKTEINWSIYIHKQKESEAPAIKDRWRELLGLSPENFVGTWYKHHDIKTNYSSSKKEYLGVLRLRVQKSSKLQRKVQGWIYGLGGGEKWKDDLVLR